MPYPIFDRSRLRVRPLAERRHDLDLSMLLPLDADLPSYQHPAIPILAKRLLETKERGAARIVFLGGHVIKSGTSRFLIDMMERGWIDHVAVNGSVAIHDWELALAGATAESVAHYVRDGQFGLWAETGAINDAILQGHARSLGMGEALGCFISESDFDHKEVSILAAAYRLKVPLTVHVGIGCDIVHEHLSCDGEALGQTSYQDFLVFAYAVSRLEGGVFLNFGSAVMGPEVFLKALSMARNVAEQDGKTISHFTTAVFDLMALGSDFSDTADPKDVCYYFRPYKTLLVRSVGDAGKSYYVQGEHRRTIPALHRALLENDRAGQ